MKLDLIIVGGGPAGSAAAIIAARAGARTLIVERERFPRERPGETLHPGVEPLFELLGVRVDGRRFRGNRVMWGNTPARFELFGAGADGEPWLGFHTPRTILDQTLLRAAAAAGAMVLEETSVDTLAIVSDMVCLRTSRGEYEAPFIIDATGAGRWVARRLRVQVEQHSPTRIAHYAWTRGVSLSEEPSIRSGHGGWVWTAGIADGLCAWSRVGGDGSPPEELRSGVEIGRPRVADVTARIAVAPAGARHYLVGDAAFVIDPIAGHGVLRALMTGIAAATAIVTSSPPARYSDWIHDWFRRDAAAVEELYRRAP